MIQPILLIDQVFAMEVPADAGKPTILVAFQPNTLSYEYSVEKRERCETGLIAMIDLPLGNWQLIGATKDLTEEQARQIVEQVGLSNGWKDYDTNNIPSCYPYISPIESFRSLLIAKGLDVNKNYILLKKQ